MRLFTKYHVLTAVLAAGGVMIFLALDLPLPFLFGPLAACLVAALAGVRLQGMGQLAIFARTILGVAVGAAVSPELLSRLPAMMASLALIPLYILVIGTIGIFFFRRVCKLDPVTSYYAAMPGGLQDMVIFGEEAGGDVRALSLIHATRVLVIVTLTPILLKGLYNVGLNNPIGAHAMDLPMSEMLLMAVAAIVGWKGGERLKLFGASIIGPLILTAVLSLTGLIHNRPPAEAILTAQFFIGIGIGVYYVGITLSDLRRYVLSAFAFVLILALLAACFTAFVSLVGLAHPVEAFLSFCPGGQAEMTILAIVSGADLGFVVTHHILRIVLVITGAPFIAKFLGNRTKEKINEDRHTG